MYGCMYVCINVDSDWDQWLQIVDYAAFWVLGASGGELEYCLVRLCMHASMSEYLSMAWQCISDECSS